MRKQTIIRERVVQDIPVTVTPFRRVHCDFDRADRCLTATGRGFVSICSILPAQSARALSHDRACLPRNTAPISGPKHHKNNDDDFFTKCNNNTSA